jgi:hypothetical protein
MHRSSSRRVLVALTTTALAASGLATAALADAATPLAAGAVHTERRSGSPAQVAERFTLRLHGTAPRPKNGRQHPLRLHG